MSKLSLETLRLYNGADCDVTKRIEIANKKHVPQALMQIYIDLSYILYRMEPNGPDLDYEQQAKLGVIYPVRAERLKAQLCAMVHDPDFNPASPAQVLKAVYGYFDLQFPFKGKPNTAKNTLLTLGHKHKFPKLVVQWRRESKAEGTYITGYKACADLNNGRLKTKWKSTGTRTGRLASSGEKGVKGGGVNLQNIHNDPQIQNMLVADKRWKKLYKVIEKLLTYDKPVEWVCKKIEAWLRQKCPDLQTFFISDYGQIEVRVAAQMAGDKNLIADCQEADIHTTVGSVLTGWDPEKIRHDKATRTVTKNCHFGMLFGSGVDGVYRYVVSRTPEGVEPIGKEFVVKAMDRYFKRYTGIRAFIERQREFARENSYVETLFGMKQPLTITGESEDDEYFEDDEQRGSWWGNQCVDFKTEALSQRGWLNGQEVRVGDILLTKNAGTGKLEWQTMTDLVLYPDYEGEYWELEAKSFSAVTTPEHRWLIKQKHSGESVCKTTSKLSQYGDDKIHRTGQYEGPGSSPYADDFICLLGWVCTDGYMDKQGKGYGANSVHIGQSQRAKPFYVKEIDELLCRLGVKFRRHYHPKTEYVTWNFSGRFGALMHSVIPGRLLPYQLLSQLPLSQLRILYETMLKGDGGGAGVKNGKGIAKVSGSPGGITMGTRRKASIFQMLAMLCGYSSNSRYEDLSKYEGVKSEKMANIPKMNGCWRVKAHRREYAQILENMVTVRKGKIGMWCPVVPNSYFVARRRGQTYITGNCLNGPIQGTSHQLMECALVNLHRRPEDYKELGLPVMDVHDALYFRVNILDLRVSHQKVKKLMEQDSLAVVKSDFPNIKWIVPIVTEAEAGLSLGCKLELPDDNINIGKFCLDWYQKRKKQLAELDKELLEVSGS
jgi:DNA polymerase I-like protein with 3'-5' exonuclease and polymerase domains